MKHLNALTSLAAAAMSIGPAFDKTAVEIDALRDSVDSMGIGLRALASERHLLRRSKAHRNSKPSKVERIHRQIHNSNYNRMRRAANGRYGGEAFGFPAPQGV